MGGVNLLITGKPGAGKTALAECIVREFQASLRVASFTTTEVRDRAGERLGFRHRHRRQEAG